MSRKSLGMISGKVRVADVSNLDPNRFEFLDLANAEPNPGVPPESNGILASNTDGTRKWLTIDIGLSVSGSNELFVDETGVPIDTTSFNFSSSNVLSDVLADFDTNITNAVAGNLNTVASDSSLLGDGTTENPLSVVDGSGSGLDADTLDGENGTFYLDYTNFTNVPTIGDGTITVEGFDGLSGTDSFTTNQSTNLTITLTNVDKGSSQNIFKDIAVSGETSITADSNSETVEFVEGTGISLSTDNTTKSITISSTAEASLENSTTDDLDEGLTNLYYTDDRVRNAVSALGDISYNSSTGEFSFTERTDQEVRNLFSASGDLSYNSSTGVFSVTTYKSTDFDTDFAGKSTSDLTEGTNLYYTDARVRNALSASGDLSYNSSTGNFSVTTYKTSDFNIDFNTKDTDDLSEGLNNLYYTNDRVNSHLSGGTGVTYTSGSISIGQDVDPSSNVEFADLVVTGNLTVQGSQTVLETATLQVEDQNIELGKVASPSNSTANTGGITVLAGTDGDKTWKWLSATDSWTSSEHIDVTNGKEYRINDNKVLDFNSLGSSVVSSSLTSVGTLNSGSISSGFGNINIGSSTFTGNGSGLTNVDAVTLEGQGGAHYLNYNNFTNTPQNLSDFNNDENFIKLTDLSAAGDLNYNASTGVFSVTTYKSADFDTDFDNKSTTDLSEGTNLYFTQARARNSVSASGDISYNASTGVFSFTERTDQEVRNLFSASGDLSYNSSTGQFSVTTYKTSNFNTDFSNKTTDDLSEGANNLYFTTGRIDNHLSGGTGVTYSNGNISIGQDVATSSNVTFEQLTLGSGVLGGVDPESHLRIAYPGNWSNDQNDDQTALYIQTNGANDSDFPYGVVGIRFATSTADNFGPLIGGTRTGSGSGDFVVKTGGSNVQERFRIADNGAATFSSSVSASSFSGDLDYNDITNPPTIGNGTLSLSTSGIASGSASFSANQTGGTSFDVSVPGTNLAMGGSGNSRIITSSTGNNVSIPIATTTNAGFMSTNDKSKLDGIEDGITSLQFFLADGSRSDISLTTENELPFFLADGSQNNIPLAA